MKIVTAIDSFKGSLSTISTGNAAAEGIKCVYPDAEIIIRPLADGGEGTVRALICEDTNHLHTVTVHNPLGEPVAAEYGITEDGTAVIEMAAAAGITLINENERNPLNTTTFGVGEIIKDAISKNCRNFIIGIGGSATNDGGLGMLQALGFDFLDENGNSVCFGAKGLEKLASVSAANALPELANCHFHVACDVKNTLCGSEGCSAVFGPQKGATPQMVAQMDLWLQKFADLTHKFTGKDYSKYPGAGAAGGLGFALISYLNASLEPGIDLIIRETRLEEYIKNADIVITGEGRLDDQTCMGKAPVGVADIAKKYDIPVIAFSGCVTDGARLCNEHGIDAFFPILRTPCTLKAAMDCDNAYANMKNSVEQVFRLIKTMESKKV